MVQVRIRRLLLWVALPALVLILLYTVLGFFVVPRLIRSGVHDFVAKNYHRGGRPRRSPVQSVYAAAGRPGIFRCPDSDGQPMLAFRHLLVDLTVASVWRLGPDFESILLEQPFARGPDQSRRLPEFQRAGNCHRRRKRNRSRIQSQRGCLSSTSAFRAAMLHSRTGRTPVLFVPRSNQSASICSTSLRLGRKAARMR